MKVIAIAKRGSKRDLYDMWFLIRKWSIEDLTNFSKQRAILTIGCPYSQELWVTFTMRKKRKNPFIDPDWEEFLKLFLKS